MTLPAILSDPALAPVLAALPRARLVGGCVRDTLAGLPVADIDLATPDTPDEITAALRKAGLRAIATGEAHGTITAISAGRPFEITTLRRDEETDGRHARVAWTSDFTEDAARRDFTINAMSLDRAGRLYDPFGGEADLEAGRVRFVGDAATRVAEDHLRILRFFRFFARYGKPPPDAGATAAIQAGVAGLRRLSAERVWSELKRILAVTDPLPSLKLMNTLGVLQEVLPGAALTSRLAALIQAGGPADPVLRLAAMLEGEPGALSRRLKLSGAERDRLAALLSGPVPQPGAPETDLRRLLADESAAILIGRAWLAHPDDQDLRRWLALLPTPVFPLEGRHALAAGWQPGPALGEALRRVRARWLDGGCEATLEQCLAWLGEPAK